MGEKRDRPSFLQRFTVSFLLLALTFPFDVGVLEQFDPQKNNSTSAEPSTAPSPVNSASSACTSPTSTDSTSLEIVDPFLQKLNAYLSAPPFPRIHGRARFAHVSLIMYHDILPEKEVFFDVTPAELEAHFQQIQANGLTPITLDQLVVHLSSGIPLPEKPILLTFDDGYRGHYEYVYPLLRKYNYPAVLGIYPDKITKKLGRPGVTWEQLQAMARDPLITIASHSVSHPADLRALPDDRLAQEVNESKRQLEAQLGIAIDYFVYPEGNYDERVVQAVKQAGYRAALTMSNEHSKVAGESTNLLAIERLGQSELADAIPKAYGGPPLPELGDRVDFTAPIQLRQVSVNQVPLILVSGGQAVTFHADRRYQVPEIIANTPAIAAVDGGFFSLESLDSNTLIGPVLSQNTQRFIPGTDQQNRAIAGRPLVLISPSTVKFIRFDPERHNTLAGIQAVLPDVTDAFVAGAWLVKDHLPQEAHSFGQLYGFDAARDRAFWGIDRAGKPVVGVSADYVDSVSLGQALSRAGFREAVMLDSGASAALAYQGRSMMSYEPRPVPHVVALLPPQAVPVSTPTPVCPNPQ